MYAASTRASSNSIAWVDRALNLANLGDMTGARAMIDENNKRFPSTAMRVSAAGDKAAIELAASNYPRAAAILDSLSHSDVGGFKVNFYSMLAFIAPVQGQLSRMRPMLGAMSAAMPVNARSAPLIDSLALSMVDVSAAEQPDRAVRRLDATLATTPFSATPISDRDYLTAVTVYARAGRVDRAKAVLAQRTNELHDTTRLRSQMPQLHQALGEIAIAEGRPKDAISEFWKGDSLPDGPYSECDACTWVNLARAYDKANLPDSAVVYFEKFFASTSIERLQADYFARGPALRRLGELYEAKGDRAKATHYYQEFVNLWKNADPELQPQVAEVKRRLARLDKGSG